MASSVKHNMNMNLMTLMFGNTSKTAKKSAMSLFGGSFSFMQSSDMFFSRGSTQLLQSVVTKMQAVINRSPFGASSPTSASSRTGNAAPAETVVPEPPQWQIDQAVNEAGGKEAFAPWLVDGKTKVNVGGRSVAATLDPAAAEAAAGGSAREQAEKSIARFGMAADRLDGDLDALRSDLKAAAAQAGKQDPKLTGAVEYALEDAFAKIHAIENDGKTSSIPDYEKQRKINLEQAASVARQLNLGEGDTWGIESLAQDLATFGLDLTALSRNPHELAEEIKAMSKTMLEELGSRYTGSESEFIATRNRITGSSARLVNGLSNSGGAAIMGMASASVSVTGKVNVNIGGASVNAASLIAVGNVITDPLVLDLNGDGINLKSSEEGVAFDMNGNGETEKMGFIQGDDAFLFMDTHGDGVVHDGRQLFGNNNGYANGFDMLRAYDDNGDGVIDEQDEIFEQLRLWVENNADGVCEKSETMSLKEAGIKSINLGYQNVREDDGKGNLIGQTGSFTRDDGSQGLAADVWLQTGKA